MTNIIIHAMALVVATWLVEAATLRLRVPHLFHRRQFIDLFWINALTNPMANWLYQAQLWPWAAVESIVFLIEIYPIGKSLNVPIKEALRLSLIANGTSALVGLGLVLFQ